MEKPSLIVQPETQGVNLTERTGMTEARRRRTKSLKRWLKNISRRYLGPLII